MGKPKLTPEQLEAVRERAKALVAQAQSEKAERTGKERKEWVTQTLKTWIKTTFESYDQLIPAVGGWLDLPFVDGLEAQCIDLIVGFVVEWAWTRFKLEG